MKTIFTVFFAALLAAAAPAQSASQIQTAPAEEETLLPNKIYFFVHSLCQNCRLAYIYLNTTHPELNIPLTDMKFHHNLDLYKQCVKKFNIPNQELTLPLICMGEHYIMGWNEQSPSRFEEILPLFQAQTQPQN